jgi:hypothetical protein
MIAGSCPPDRVAAIKQAFRLSFAKNASGDMSLRCDAFITVMQTAELRDLDDPADS